jgi:hypothetical protein
MFDHMEHEINIYSKDVSQVITGSTLNHDGTPLICFQNYINIGMRLKYHQETFFILGCE